MKKRLHTLGDSAGLQKRLGAIVRTFRHRLHLTQRTLAVQAKMHRTHIADIERGARNVTLRTVAILAKSLQTSVGSLFSHLTVVDGATLRGGEKNGPNELQDIMLVEHNAAAAAATARAFKRARLAKPLTIVRDGETALAWLFGTGRYAKRKPELPQLILLVPDLPRMSASEFRKRVKADPRTRSIPVVMLSVS